MARRVVVTGEVQGVFYRAACAHRAGEEAVAGWIRNRADGRVEAMFEGDPQAVDNLVAWCRHGPAQASVSGVVVSEERPAGLETFRIQ